MYQTSGPPHAQYPADQPVPPRLSRAADRHEILDLTHPEMFDRVHAMRTPSDVQPLPRPYPSHERNLRFPSASKPSAHLVLTQRVRGRRRPAKPLVSHPRQRLVSA